ncbi:MAG TPA: cysteine--tRNA ligase [Candidatus Dormibacteraeota bacterium]|nr:cysteine--tRNA ligase [Candidatus Dormibacteraeota bacterium]
MKLYNTLNRRVEEIKPQKRPLVTVYTCGPTVYDFPHIGNWFTFIRYDLLVRALKANGYQPKWVLNITDVGHLVSDADSGEDKLEKGAKREGKSAWDIAKFYSDYFIDGLRRLNISKPDYLPKATDHIVEQVELIKTLEAKGFTYLTSDGVYYDSSKFPQYSSFAALDLDEQQASGRIEPNPNKHQASDFALWKFSPKGQKRDMEWDSPWGRGFPGWHIECSAMSIKYLGPTLDIHCGGIDHLPVHHTNEIAQSEAATGKRFANYWMHTNHITISGEKIAKSANNSLRLEDLESHGFSLDSLRMHVLESHYRSQSKFSWLSLESAQNRLRSLQNLACLRWQLVTQSKRFNFESASAELLEAISDDLDTPKVVARLSYIENVLSRQLISSDQKKSFEKFIETIDNLLGLELSNQPDITELQKEDIKKRQAAREDGKWDEADRLRDKLNDQKLGVRDTEFGPIWFRL